MEINLLNDLAPVLIHYAEVAGKEVRKIYFSEDLCISNKVEDTLIQDTTEAENCHAGDILTRADQASQNIIVNGILSRFPNVRLIAEEEEQEVKPSRSFPAYCRKQIELEYNLGQMTKFSKISISDIAIFVDPVDGTKEFACRRGYSSSILIGVCYKDEPVMGVVHEPFRALNGDWQPSIPEEAKEPHFRAHTTFGLVGHNIVGLHTFPREVSTKPVILTPRTKPQDLIDTLKRLDHVEADISLGGFGSKGLRVLENRADCVIVHPPICQWDVCAIEALARAAGLLVYDTFGRRIQYGKNTPHVVPGVIVTKNTDILEKVVTETSRLKFDSSVF